MGCHHLAGNCLAGPLSGRLSPVSCCHRAWRCCCWFTLLLLLLGVGAGWALPMEQERTWTFLPKCPCTGMLGDKEQCAEGMSPFSAV